MKITNGKSLLPLVVVVGLLLVSSACQRADNSNTNLAANANTSPANVNANLAAEPASVIAAREPEKYRAILVFSAETETGQKTVGIPTLSAEVARNGSDRRVAFKLPDGSDLIYLEQGGKHIVIVPGRKQYAELTPEATGFQLQKLMTPGQLVAYLEKLPGVERVGDETINGRTADKYRYANTTNTSTSAGEVKSKAFVYVDKETGLPLRVELFTEASGNVQGVKGAKIVAEMRDVSTTVDDSLFQVPAGLNKVPPEQVRSQIDEFTSTVAVLLKALLSNMNTAAPDINAPAVWLKSQDTATRNEAQRLARAAEVRSYMREQNIPASVVASDTQLSVQYEAASGDYLPEIFQTFCRQQNTASLMAAGFETIEIRARDSFGNMKSRTFPLSDCKK